MATTDDLLARAKDLIRERQFDRARIVLQDVLRAEPGNNTAQDWLARLEKVDPAPRTFQESQVELTEAREELREAEVEIAQTEQTARRFVRLNVALLVFLGSLLGSLLGAAADLGDALDTVEEVRTRLYPELCVAGSSTVLEEGLGLAEGWTEDFTAINEVRVNVEAIGSGAGVDRASQGGCVHVLAMSEPMTDSQFQQLADSDVNLVCAAEIGYDVVVFVTHNNNPVTVLDDRGPRSLSAILSGSITNWAELNPSYDFPITIYVRPRSGTTELILSRLLVNFDNQGATNFPPGVNFLECNSNEECLNLTLGTPGALYWVSASWIRTQPPEFLRVISILQGDERSVNPLNEDVNLERYPKLLMRPLYLYVVDGEGATPDDVQRAQDYLTFVRGIQGQQTLEAAGFFTYFDAPRDIEVLLPSGFDSVGTPGRRICQ
ncbi:MAG: hypothetical protein HC915_20470 [Anaerolineae bacterium]|nr:hypothetical protein [Anaerolineae bacterium]